LSQLPEDVNQQIETEILVPPEFLSPSSISTWQQCPLKYKYSKIDKIIDPPTEATVLGNFVHDALERLLLSPPESRTLSTAQSIMRSLWSDEYQNKAADVLHGHEAKMHEFRWRAWWCVENYFLMENPAEVSFEGLEDYVTGKVGDASLRGYIDRWGKDANGIVIGDYKTGKTPRPQWRNGKFQQLLIYAVLLGEIHQTKVNSLELLYLKDGVRLTHPVKTKELDETKKTIISVHAEIQEACATSNFEAKKHRLCDWCAYKSFCPAWN
jgi:putative RecB family exonuclease